MYCVATGCSGGLADARIKAIPSEQPDTHVVGSSLSATSTKYTTDLKTKKVSELADLILSGYQDSNLGPPAPKAGALTGLRYIPLLLNCGAKVLQFFYPANFFVTFLQKLYQ